MTYSLVEVRSFTPKGKGFCLPIFSDMASNDAFVQNLDPNGMILDFLKVRIEQFHRVQILPPPIELDCQLQGVLAFVDDDGALHVGTIQEMKSILESFDVADPFVRLEVSALLNSAARQKDALDECAVIMGQSDLYDSWSKRERKLFRVAETELAVESDIMSEDEDRFRLEFDSLGKDLENDAWVPTWIKLWTQNYRRAELIGLAALRLDSGVSLHSNGPKVFILIVASDHSDFVISRVMKALHDAELDVEHWYSLYSRVHYMAHARRKDLQKLGLTKLDSAIEAKKGASSAWMNLWSLLYNSGVDREYLRSLAAEYVNSRSILTTTTVRLLIFPFRRDLADFEPFLEISRNWVLQNFRSSVLWSEMYLAVFSDDDLDLLEHGRRWLRLLGGNIKAWVTVWHRLAPHMSESEQRKLAISWLRRARWDMRAWVDVFLELCGDKRLRDSGELLSIGEMWLSLGSGLAANRLKIRRAIEYLRALDEDVI